MNEEYDRRFDAIFDMIAAARQNVDRALCCQLLFSLWESGLSQTGGPDARRDAEMPVFTSAAILIRRSHDWVWGCVWAWLRETALRADAFRLAAMDAAVFEVIVDKLDLGDPDEFQDFHQLIGLMAGARGSPAHDTWRSELAELIRPYVPDYGRQLQASLA